MTEIEDFETPTQEKHIQADPKLQKSSLPSKVSDVESTENAGGLKKKKRGPPKPPPTSKVVLSKEQAEIKQKILAGNKLRKEAKK